MGEVTILCERIPRTGNAFLFHLISYGRFSQRIVIGGAVHLIATSLFFISCALLRIAVQLVRNLGISLRNPSGFFFVLDKYRCCGRARAACGVAGGKRENRESP
jgi:hypothetical protein